MRHAKSSWSESGLDDHDRPLNRRGELAASLIGAWIALQDWPLDAAVISTSRRTVETWGRLAPMLAAPPEARREPALYLASLDQLLAVSRALPAEARTALVMGHNPEIGEFVNHLSVSRRVHTAPTGRMPTAAVAVLRIDGPWREIAPGACALEQFETPKSLV